MYNILHVNSGRLDGGASKGALNLHFELLKKNWNSRFLSNVSNLQIPDEYRDSVFSTKDEKRLMSSEERVSLRHQLGKTYPKHHNYIFTTGFDGYDLLKSRHYDWADIIQLHWVSDGFLQTKSIGDIHKPIIWSIRDMWPITGGCHYTFETNCNNFETHCGNCPHLGSEQEIDLSYIVYSEKNKAYKSNIYPIGISDWITNLSNKSSLFKNYTKRIYNGIDCELFFPIEKTKAWQYFDKRPPKDSLVIGFGAAGIGIEDKRKGFSYLEKSIAKLQGCIPIELLIFGECTKEFNSNTTILGNLSSVNDVRMAYNCCDVFIAPYIQETFGKTIAEAQCCEIPVICFPGSGSEEIISDGRTGYITYDISVDSLSDSIAMIWEIGHSKRRTFGYKARDRVIKNFNISILIKEYIKMYEVAMEKQSVDELKLTIIQQKKQLIEIAEESEKEIQKLNKKIDKLLKDISSFKNTLEVKKNCKKL